MYTLNIDMKSRRYYGPSLQTANQKLITVLRAVPQGRSKRKDRQSIEGFICVLNSIIHEHSCKILYFFLFCFRMMDLRQPLMLYRSCMELSINMELWPQQSVRI